jgi:hypothetical protein
MYGKQDSHHIVSLLKTHPKLELEDVIAGLRYCQFHIFSQDVLVTYHGCSALGACRAWGYNRGEPGAAGVFLES